jgi:sialic acid synthase SpsE
MNTHSVTSNGSAYVIMEAGSCGDAKLGMMLTQIHDGVAAGANAIKFQWTSDAVRMAKLRKAETDGYIRIYKKFLQWPSKWHEILERECTACGVDYLCSVYLSKDIRVIADVVSHFKIASFECMDRGFVQSHSSLVSRKRKVFISTGMASTKDVDLLYRKLLKEDFEPGSFGFLHCVSSYPTVLDDMNLRVLRRRHYVGYSDHTNPSLTMSGAMAVAAGARVVEAHARSLGTSLSNPDYVHAMDPSQFRDYVRQIRVVDRAMGGHVKSPMASERLMSSYRRHKGWG